MSGLFGGHSEPAPLPPVPPPVDKTAAAKETADKLARERNLKKRGLAANKLTKSDDDKSAKKKLLG